MRLRFLLPLALLALAGCWDLGGSGQSYIPPAPQQSTPPSLIARHKRVYSSGVPRYVYVTDRGNMKLWVYPYGVTNPQPVRSADLNVPLWVTVDADGSVYVTQWADSKIAVFNDGATAQTGTITTNVEHPTSVTADANGDLFVGNEPADGPPVIREYAPDNYTQIRSISAPGTNTLCGGVAVNQDGTVFSDVNVPGQTVFLAEVYPIYQVIWASGGCGGVAVYNGDNIIQGDLSVVATFSSLYKRERWQDFQPYADIKFLTANDGAVAIPFSNIHTGQPAIVVVESDSASVPYVITLPAGAFPGGAVVGP